MTDPITRVRAMAPVKEVHHALTDAAALRVWLAEHAEVDLPHRYEFWGRYTPEGDAPHQTLRYVDDVTLRFGWLLDGEDTETEFRLTEDGDSTIISVYQTGYSFDDAMSGATIRGVLGTFWALSTANLVDFVEGREVGPRTDFTSSDLRAEFLVDAPVDAVFASLTDSEQANIWFGYPVGIEPWVGGRFAMGGLDNNPHPAKIIDLEQDRLISIDWGAEGVSTWELADSAGKTRLTFVQSGFDDGNPPFAAWTGTLGGISQLRRFHEIKPWRAIWLPTGGSVDEFATWLAQQDEEGDAAVSSAATRQ
jgi:uncharacterized protein YndB with AHSA1/START domain